MKTQEIYVKTILTRTNIPGMDYCINPYIGCSHACRYCYATYMRKYSGHDEPWGSFLDVKANAVELLKKALRRDRRGQVILSSVTDPYQEAEASYGLTRGCLELLSRSRLSVSVLTKSDLVIRDADIMERMESVEVGLTITTNSEIIKRVFEPHSPSIASRVRALRVLQRRAIPRFVFIGPILPMDPVKLAELIGPSTQRVLIDRMNYTWKVKETYREHRMQRYLDESYFAETEARLLEALRTHGVDATVVWAGAISGGPSSSDLACRHRTAHKNRHLKLQVFRHHPYRPI